MADLKRWAKYEIICRDSVASSIAGFSNAADPDLSYSIPKELASFREPDGRLSVEFDGVLDVSVVDQKPIRIPVAAFDDGTIEVEPLNLTLISESGHKYTGGFTTCSIGQIPAQVVVEVWFKFRVNCGVSFVPEAGRYRVRLEVRAYTAAGEMTTLSVESSVLIKEPNQPPQRNAGSHPSSGDSSASETPSSLGPRG